MDNKPSWKWLDKLGDIFCSVVLLGAIALCAIIMMLSTGCSTCPPCQPTIETVEVLVPTYSCPPPPEALSPEIPAFPMLPDNHLTDQEKKNWYAEVASLVKARDKILLDYVKYLQEILDEYRSP